MGARIQIPGKLVLQSMKDGDVYFFDKGVNIGIPEHLHICVVKDSVNGTLIFACCTSQIDTMNRLILKKNLSSETIVYMKKSQYPFLTKDTYINCNDVFKMEEKDFINEYDRGNISKRDGIELGHYSQILNGIQKSDLVEEELKDVIANISLDKYRN